MCEPRGLGGGECGGHLAQKTHASLLWLPRGSAQGTRGSSHAAWLEARSFPCSRNVPAQKGNEKGTYSVEKVEMAPYGTSLCVFPLSLCLSLFFLSASHLSLCLSSLPLSLFSLSPLCLYYLSSLFSLLSLCVSLSISLSSYLSPLCFFVFLSLRLCLSFSSLLPPFLPPLPLFPFKVFANSLRTVCVFLNSN